MNQRLLLSGIALLILVSLLAGPVLAATVTCPPTCSCLLPAEAANINTPGLCGGKQQVCAEEGKTVKYCYLKPVTTTPVVPKIIVTGYQIITTTPTTIAPQKCASGCSCLSTADGKGKGLQYCGGTQTVCGSSGSTPLYCFAQPGVKPDSRGIVTEFHVVNTTTAVPPGPLVIPGQYHILTTETTLPPAVGSVPVQNRSSCPAGCTCLRPADADAKGLRYCNGKQTPCTAPASLTAPGVLDKETRYCYSMLAGSSVPAPVLIPAVIMTTPIPIPAGPAIASSAAGPAAGGDILSMVGTFLASVLGGNPQQSPSGEVSLSMCKVRYGLDTCTDGCVNLSTDPDNCGTCGHWCASGERCIMGRCSNAESDPSNCGGAGNICPPGAPCIEGYCSALGCLDSYLTDCNNTCTDTRHDALNCGACGNVCPAGQDCSWGTCTPCSAAGNIYCPSHDERYSDCTDISTDFFNCGRCQHACGSDEVCLGGTCSVCPEGTRKCGTRCVDMMTDRYACGSCYTRCGYDQACVNGTCSCLDGAWACGSACVDLRSSSTNCGRCDNRCPDGTSCSDGRCQCPGYESGMRYCDGHCIDTSSDDDNCGRCGNECSSWNPYCREGQCCTYASGDCWGY